MVCESTPRKNAYPKEYPVSIIAQSINFNDYTLTDTTATMFIPDPNGIRAGKFPEILFRIKNKWKREEKSTAKEKIYLLEKEYNHTTITYTLKMQATAFADRGKKFDAIFTKKEKNYEPEPDVKLKCEFKPTKALQDNFDDNLE